MGTVEIAYVSDPRAKYAAPAEGESEGGVLAPDEEPAHAFLSEEIALLGVVAERVGNLLSRTVVEEKISRLTNTLSLCTECATPTAGSRSSASSRSTRTSRLSGCSVPRVPRPSSPATSVPRSTRIHLRLQSIRSHNNHQQQQPQMRSSNHSLLHARERAAVEWFP